MFFILMRQMSYIYSTVSQHMIRPFMRQICIIETVLAIGFVFKQGKINTLLICLSLGSRSICDYLFSLTFLVPFAGGNLKA